MCDGLGSTHFLSSVAEFARGAKGPCVEPVVWERAALLGPRDPPRVQIPSLYDHLELEKGFCAYGEVDYRISRECFHVREDCLERFTVRLGKESGSSFTTFEALGAFIWRARYASSL